MKKIISLIASTVMILSASGCGLFGGSSSQGSLFQNNPIRSFFQGAPCSTCNPPSGQISSSNFNGNVAPLCRDGNCHSGSPISTPANVQRNDPGVPYYDNGSGVSSRSPIQLNGGNVLPQGTIVPNGNSNVIQGSSNRVPFGAEELPSIDVFSNPLDADAWPPLP